MHVEIDLRDRVERECRNDHVLELPQSSVAIRVELQRRDGSGQAI